MKQSFCIFSLIAAFLLSSSVSAGVAELAPSEVASGCSLLILMSDPQAEHRFPSRMEAQTIYREMVREGEVLDHRVWVWALRSTYPLGSGELDRQGVLRDPRQAAAKVVTFVETLFDRTQTSIDNAHGSWRVLRNYNEDAKSSPGDAKDFRESLEALAKYGLSRADYDAIFDLAAQLGSDDRMHDHAVGAITSLIPAFVELTDPQAVAPVVTQPNASVTSVARLRPSTLMTTLLCTLGGGLVVSSVLDLSWATTGGFIILLETGAYFGHDYYTNSDSRSAPQPRERKPKAKPAGPLSFLARLKISPDAEKLAVQQIQGTAFPVALLNALAPLVGQSPDDAQSIPIEDGKAYNFLRGYLPITLPEPMAEALLTAEDTYPVVKESLRIMESATQLSTRAVLIRERLWGAQIRTQRTELAEFIDSLDKSTDELPKRSAVLVKLGSIMKDFAAEAELMQPHVEGLSDDIEKLTPLLDAEMRRVNAALAAIEITTNSTQADLKRVEWLTRAKRNLQSALLTMQALTVTHGETLGLLTFRMDNTNKLRTSLSVKAELENPISSEELALMKKILGYMSRN